MLRNLYKKHKDIIPYIFFGVCTTIINVIVYWIISHMFKAATMPSTIVAWLVAVFFAYITNRKWVFHSEATTLRKVIIEGLSFLGCRLATGVLDWLCMFVFVDILKFNDLIIKLMANILVIVLNYLASKLIIFKKII